MNRLQVLALSPVPYEGAGCRFRISQYVPYLAAQGIDVTVAPFYDREFFRLVYQPRRHARKAVLFVKQAAARVLAVARAGRLRRDLDLSRGASVRAADLRIGAVRVRAGRCCYDFDDAIFLTNTSEANRYARGAEVSAEDRLDHRAARDQVIAGNEYLARMRARSTSRCR